MKRLVHKYGGTSLASIARIKNVAERVAKWRESVPEIVVVVSAMAGETNRLIDLGKSLSENPNRKSHGSGRSEWRAGISGLIDNCANRVRLRCYFLLWLASEDDNGRQPW